MKRIIKNMLNFHFPKNQRESKHQLSKHKNKIIHRTEEQKKMLFLKFKSNYSKKYKTFHQILHLKTPIINKNLEKLTMIVKIFKNRFREKIYDHLI